MRIIAGRHRGRRLTAPAGLEVRPTAERAREALMSILEHGTPPLRDARVLDLFAGTGAVALEALSRGARLALLVERDRRAQAAIRANVMRLGEGERARLLPLDATRLGPAAHPFEIAFLDPPYRSGLAAPALASLRAGGWLVPAARVVVERPAAERSPAIDGFTVDDERRYGAAAFLFLRAPN